MTEQMIATIVTFLSGAAISFVCLCIGYALGRKTIIIADNKVVDAVEPIDQGTSEEPPGDYFNDERMEYGPDNAKDERIATT